MEGLILMPGWLYLVIYITIVEVIFITVRHMDSDNDWLADKACSLLFSIGVIFFIFILDLGINISSFTGENMKDFLKSAGMILAIVVSIIMFFIVNAFIAYHIEEQKANKKIMKGGKKK